MDASNFIVTDDCGSPLGVMNIDLIQAEGTAMSYSLAAAAGDKDALDQIAAATWLGSAPLRSGMSPPSQPSNWPRVSSARCSMSSTRRGMRRGAGTGSSRRPR